MTPQPDLFNTVVRISFSFRFPSISPTNWEASRLQTVWYMTLFLDIITTFCRSVKCRWSPWHLQLHKLKQPKRGMFCLTFLQLTHVHKHTVSVMYSYWKLRCWTLIIKQPYVRREQCQSKISKLSLVKLCVWNMGFGLLCILMSLVLTKQRFV